MYINKFAKDWCDNTYDTNDEKFYEDNIRYLLAKGIGLGFIKFSCTIVALTAFLIALDKNYSVMTIVSNLTLTYLFYAFASYGSNKNMLGILGSPFVYAFVAIVKFLSPQLTRDLISISTMIVYIMLAIKYIKSYYQTREEFKKTMYEHTKKEEETEKAQYKQWNNYNKKYERTEDYRTYNQYSTNQNVSQGSPMEEKAKKLFEGFMGSKAAMKSRYRELAKQYHPDHGGDEEMFKAVKAVYEQYK